LLLRCPENQSAERSIPWWRSRRCILNESTARIEHPRWKSCPSFRHGVP
jgi:hypothetical protein